MKSRKWILPLFLAAGAACFGQQKGFAPKLPPHVKLLTPAKPGPGTERPVAQAKADSLGRRPTCGHLVVQRASPDVDPGMLTGGDPKHAYRMPVHKGLPSCQDTDQN